MHPCLMDGIRYGNKFFLLQKQSFFLDYPSPKDHVVWTVRSENPQPPLSHQGAIEKYFLPLKITLCTARAQTECQQTGPVRLLY